MVDSEDDKIKWLSCCGEVRKMNRNMIDKRYACIEYLSGNLRFAENIASLIISYWWHDTENNLTTKSGFTIYDSDYHYHEDV